ncbi:YlqD family protein [Gracilibacillus caseinilyticus]|uniref:YlqD family protein n=1 Tax=Gracilibacillus caseinilyticus TaxID=2932256 RepID=A0ABY4EV96_9BACI|nr:YlqD family protein [Gracilibacillus caseinilyticus]UOQ47900.1 YlqD family protein [Gracilibacillus caseinilyticus]
MKIIKKVAIKKIVTDQSKANLREEYQFKIFKLEQECEQLKFEQKKLEQRSANKKADIATRFKKEISNRKDQIKWYKYKLEQLEILPVGSEMNEGEVDAIIDIEEGMRWDDITSQRSIVIQDGMITKIT